MNNKSAQTAIFGSTLLLVAVFALNILISTGLPGLRLDLTQDKLYSLSDGVSPLLRALDEPVRLDFYYSKKSAENLPNFRTYGQRVEEFLEEIPACEQEFNSGASMSDSMQTCFAGKFGEEIGSDEMGAIIIISPKYKDQGLV